MAKANLAWVAWRQGSHVEAETHGQAAWRTGRHTGSHTRFSGQRAGRSSPWPAREVASAKRSRMRAICPPHGSNRCPRR